MRILASLVILASSISAASAADLWVEPPTLAPASVSGFDWTGFYAGMFAGSSAGRATSTSVGAGIVTNVDVSGALVGATVGANAQFDMFVLGLEGDIAWTNTSGSGACAADPTFTCNGRLEWIGSAKARAGVAFDNILIFAAGGIAAGGVHASNTPIPNNISGSYSGATWGWTAGGGVEYALSEAFSIKGEYAYYDFSGLQAPAGTVYTTPVDLSAKVHTVKVGVNYHF